MMEFSDAVEKAILAHAAWKQRLSWAIVEHSSRFTVEQVVVDDRCEFGKWFYTLPSTLRTSAEGMVVQRLHAEFHVVAAHVLELALARRVDEATRALAKGEKYALLSDQLVAAMERWKQRAAT